MNIHEQCNCHLRHRSPGNAKYILNIINKYSNFLLLRGNYTFSYYFAIANIVLVSYIYKLVIYIYSNSMQLKDRFRKRIQFIKLTRYQYCYKYVLDIKTCVIQNCTVLWYNRK